MMDPEAFNRFIKGVRLKSLWVQSCFAQVEDRAAVEKARKQKKLLLEYGLSRKLLSALAKKATAKVTFGVAIRDKSRKQNQELGALYVTFVVEYETPSKMTEEIFQQFSKVTLHVHTAPFARQWIHAQSLQMGIEPILIPLALSHPAAAPKPRKRNSVE
jgi:hypothetical protein